MAESPFLNLQMAEFLTRAASMGVQNAQNAKRLQLEQQQLEQQRTNQQKNLELREANLQLAEQRFQLDAELKKLAEKRKEADFALRKMDVTSRIATRGDRHAQNAQRFELLRQSAASRSATQQQKAIDGELEHRLRTETADKYKNPMYQGFDLPDLQRLYNNLLSQRTRDLLPEAEDALIEQLDEVENALEVKGNIIKDFEIKLDPARKQIFDSLFTPAAPSQSGNLPTEPGLPTSAFLPSTTIPSDTRPALEGSIEANFDMFSAGVRTTLGDPNADRAQLTETILNTLLNPKTPTNTKSKIIRLLDSIDPNYLKLINKAGINARTGNK